MKCSSIRSGLEEWHPSRGITITQLDVEDESTNRSTPQKRCMPEIEVAMLHLSTDITGHYRTDSFLKVDSQQAPASLSRLSLVLQNLSIFFIWFLFNGFALSSCSGRKGQWENRPLTKTSFWNILDYPHSLSDGRALAGKPVFLVAGG